MRIITGKCKGRILKVPDSKLIRPMTARIKESIFNYLNNLIDFEGITCCDVYSGSGSLGLEIYSRGAKEIHFIEKNFKIGQILKKNILSCKAEECSQVFNIEAKKFFSSKPPIQYDIIFADPPFFNYDIYEVVKLIFQNKFLAENGIILVQRSHQTEAKDIEEFKIKPERRIGDSNIFVLNNFI
ncbi:MAG: 16S rRNA (guanine(966)-N(2))-methyltransferase RsmD [Ignavibacteriales bacterium]|nr:16S rRNA (guanine(966)-N(2))-methyltransferase RsmD [Ignavibacteriales bacterium]